MRDLQDPYRHLAVAAEPARWTWKSSFVRVFLAKGKESRTLWNSSHCNIGHSAPTLLPLPLLLHSVGKERFLSTHRSPHFSPYFKLQVGAVDVRVIESTAQEVLGPAHLQLAVAGEGVVGLGVLQVSWGGRNRQPSVRQTRACVWGVQGRERKAALGGGHEEVVLVYLKKESPKATMSRSLQNQTK